MVEQSEGQPPSGGCELKLYWFVESVNLAYQPPSGGCELKRVWRYGRMLFCDSSRLRAAVS